MEILLVRTRIINFLFERHKLLGVAFKPILLLLLIKIISLEIGTFRIFELPVLFIIIGLPFAFITREHIRLTCQFHWYVMGAAVSLVLVPFLFLVSGFLNLNNVFIYSIEFTYLIALLSCILLLIFGKDEDVKDLKILTSNPKLDVLGIVLIGLMIFKFTLKNFSHTFPGWDTFTFWGLDANYIFMFNKLRDATFTTTGTFHYTSLFTVMFSIIYDIFGKIVEQYATWLNIFILGISALQVYFFIGNKSVFAKLLGLFSIIAIMEASSSSAMLFYFYADIYCAFLLLQYTLYLTSNSLDSQKSYGVRLLLIMLPLVALGFVKDRLFTFTYFFIAVYIIHDLRYLNKYLKKIIVSSSFWFSIITLIVLIFLRSLYFAPFQPSTVREVLTTQSFLSSNIATIVKYIGSIVEFFANRSFTVLILWCLQLIGMIIAHATKRISRGGYFVVAITSLCFLFFVGGYIINLRSLTSNSLGRYISIGMFTIPLTYNFLDFQTKSKTISTIKYLLVTAGTVFLISWSIVTLTYQFPFTLSRGSYSDTQLKRYYEMAETILEETGKNARILIIDDSSNSTDLTNKNLPAIFLRYYLMNNSVGGQFQWLESKNLKEFAQDNSAEYILLLSYESLFSHCETNLVEGEDYLFDLSQIDYLNSDFCPFLDTAAIPVD